MNHINPENVKNILDKVGRDTRYSQLILPIISFSDLYKPLTNEEQRVVRHLLSINPEDLGFYGSHVGVADNLENVIALPAQKFARNGHQVTKSDQYLPRHVWKAFQMLQIAMQQQIGTTVLVESGFRSAACQVITFLTFLEAYNFDIAQVARVVALPGYSQHGDIRRTAIDVINPEGIPTDEQPQHFAYTGEYNWLCKHAKDYSFTLSYPEGNQDSVQFEPWHWRFIGD